LKNQGFLLSILVLELVLAGLALAGFAQADWWQTIQLGIVEGVTEFLPISSTAHLLITSDLMHFKHSVGGTFEIFIQLGAVIAVVGFYAQDLLQQARGITTNSITRRFWLSVFVAFLPAAIIGILLHDIIKTVLFSPPVIAWALIVGGIIFIVIEYIPRPNIRVHTPQDISLLQALGIGFVQVLAMIPGVSRSGASIIGGMLAGLDRKTATAFSFYLAIPTLGAATLFDLLKNVSEINSGDLVWLLLGAMVSLVIAWLSISWLLRYVSTNNFVVFGIYRILAGGFILILISMGRL
jgi:undecaprenyl-diphosphatase